MMAPTSPRYIVTKLEGYSKPSVGSFNKGFSYHVIDTAWNYRLEATYRTEDFSGPITTARRRDNARKAAEAHAARLNGVSIA